MQIPKELFINLWSAFITDGMALHRVNTVNLQDAREALRKVAEVEHEQYGLSADDMLVLLLFPVLLAHAEMTDAINDALSPKWEIARLSEALLEHLYSLRTPPGVQDDLFVETLSAGKPGSVQKALRYAWDVYDAYEHHRRN
jgi:hypothetical protein